MSFVINSKKNSAAPASGVEDTTASVRGAEATADPAEATGATSASRTEALAAGSIDAAWPNEAAGPIDAAGPIEPAGPVKEPLPHPLQKAVDKTVVLDGSSLTVEDLYAVACVRAACVISDEAWHRVRASRARVESHVEAGDVVYGVTTGFGKLSDVQIGPEDVEQLQVNLIRSHAVGTGDPFPREVVRAMLVLRANALAKGYSGIRPETLQLLVDLVNHGVHPVVPSKGSLGASGDLAPLAHMALVLMGEGRAEYAGQVMRGCDALQAAGLQPVRLGAKEGLALINGTQAMTSVGSITVVEAKRLGLWAEVSAALTMEALRGIVSVLDPALLATRPHPEQEEVAARLRRRLSGSQRVTAQGEIRVQDPYSIRCIPQVHGASWQAWKYAHERVSVELNAATDNPIVLDDGRILSGGQFHGQPVAIAMDLLKVAAAEWANIAERRIERLVNPQLSGLSPFLAKHPGLESGLMITQYVAAALVSENKVLAHPASVDSIPSSANQEDHVSMGTIAARQAREIVQNAFRVIAIELICASQALYLQGVEDEISPENRAALAWIREIAPPLDGDASVSEAIEALAEAIREVAP
ncbi:histidine ammonia-lyase [Alicyclobacillus cycloheptanicus]|uniref:Histidine ammonia-lyase n=1 Tax=Alicyclobacillus cycloheptanicus TaxID=1457 RepID=A0ABT9XLL0_9BACL|nr:histidine ammonia-lyase [Alicyclobacillus cycloheptanicus]MDQ0190909.1 histidine ammonia-lyase [Alicyclobacillus cycloheptanicus]WDM01793.1 histidine ammonia-lyase [Alicyclobacillus cycloheptanicus]